MAPGIRPIRIATIRNSIGKSYHTVKSEIGAGDVASDPASAGIRPPGRAPVDLFGVPGSFGIHGSVRDGDEGGGGEDQGEWNRRVGAL